MPGLNLTTDVAPPAVVAGVNIMARQSTSQVLGQPIQDAVVYGMAIGGYLAGYMGWGGRNSDFFKNIGVASSALAVEKLYDALKAEGTAAARVGRRMTRVSRYPGPAGEGPFNNVRISAHGRGGVLV